jgi:hypothetical protein
MYWYNSKPRITTFGCHAEPRRSMCVKAFARIFFESLRMTTLFFFISVLPACKPDIKETGGALIYFDLKGYFKSSAVQLTAHNRPVFKTAIHNSITESKKVTIDNWERELSLFSASDINKPAWKDSYTVQNTGNAIFYKAKDPELETKEITINKDGDKVKWIIIINHTKNLLYETKEKLTYIPDSMYRVEKTQQVRLMGMNRYDIKGVLGQ